MQYVIRKSAKEHMSHISGGGDPFERGSARPLDHGHITAHYLEQVKTASYTVSHVSQLSNFTIRHGEAVACGTCCDAVYQHLQGHLSLKSLNRILSLFSRV